MQSFCLPISSNPYCTFSVVYNKVCWPAAFYSQGLSRVLLQCHLGETSPKYNKGNSFDSNQRSRPQGWSSSLDYVTFSSDWEVCTHLTVRVWMYVCVHLCMCVCTGKVGPPLRPPLPNTSMQGSLESGVQQHKDQGYSGAASRPSADRKGLMSRGTHRS